MIRCAICRTRASVFGAEHVLNAKARAAGLTAAYYAAIFLALGAYLPYWPAWLEGWGLGTTEIGWFLGAATLARIVGSTLLSALADRYGIRRWLVAGTTLAAAALVVAHLTIIDQGLLFGATLALAVVMAPAMPLGEGLGLRASVQFGFAYAPVRAAGSVAFLGSNVAVGAWLGQFGPDVVVYVVAAGLVVTALLGLVHPGGGAGPAAASDRAKPADFRRLARARVFVIFTLAASLGQAAHGVYYVYSVLDWQVAGITPATIGWLWASGVIAETVLLLGPGRTLVARIGPAWALALAAFAGVVRWGLMSLSPGLPWLWPLQAMHALTFAVAHLGAIAFIAQAIPPRMAASTQGVLSGVIGGSISAGALFLAAALTQAAGIGAAYAMAMGMAALSVALSFVLGATWRGERLIADGQDP